MLSAHVINVVLETSLPVGYNEFHLSEGDALTMDGMDSDAKSVSLNIHRLLGDNDMGIYSRTASLSLEGWMVPLPWSLEIRSRQDTRRITATTTSVETEVSWE